MVGKKIPGASPSGPQGIREFWEMWVKGAYGCIQEKILHMGSWGEKPAARGRAKMQD